ncbi:hypothetical protein CW731_01405 [Polaribacter sp. ALD11]|uniref:hypothetical protein n=1 Tax=Polaribacter sp. ALD11 TaxID=2058137 RepID=UPI000C31A747|nr:hypothetical protein [Polaribacter sp. ALD11]AUC84030.1 hypothetical protein CW731_01405 [Polaribacter sp. ALD11]
MKKFNKRVIKNILTVVFAVLFIFCLSLIDWNNLGSKNNSGAFFGVLSAVLFIISMQVKNKESKKDN